MFDIGFWEMVVVGIVALVVIGPERLPAVARTLGRWTAKARNFIANTRADLEREFDSESIRRLLDDKQGEINELRNMLNETRASFEQAKDKYIVRAMEDDEPKLDEPSAEVEAPAEDPSKAPAKPKVEAGKGDSTKGEDGRA